MALQLRETTFTTPGGMKLHFSPATGDITVVDPGPASGKVSVGDPVPERIYAEAFQDATGGASFATEGEWSFILTPDGTPYVYKTGQPLSQAKEAGKRVVQGKMSPHDAIITRIFKNQIPKAKEIPQTATAPVAAPAKEAADEMVEERGPATVRPTRREEGRVSSQQLSNVRSLGRSRRTALLRGLGALVSGQSLGEAIEPSQGLSEAEMVYRRSMMDNLTALEKAQRGLQGATFENQTDARLELMKAALGVARAKVTASAGLEGQKAAGELDLAQAAMERANEMFKLENPASMMSDTDRAAYGDLKNVLSGTMAVPATGASSLMNVLGFMERMDGPDAALRPAIKDELDQIIRTNKQLKERRPPINNFEDWIKGADATVQQRFLERLGEGENARSQVISDADLAAVEAKQHLVSANQHYGTRGSTAINDALTAIGDVYGSDDPSAALAQIGEAFGPGKAFEAIRGELDEPRTTLLTPSRAKQQILESQEYKEYAGSRMDAGEVDERKIFRDYTRQVRQRGRQQQHAAEETGGRGTEEAQEGMEQVAAREEEDIIQPIAAAEEAPAEETEKAEASEDQVGWARKKGQALQSVFKEFFERQEEAGGPQVINQPYREGSPLEPGQWEDPEEGVLLSQQQLRGIPQVRRQVKYGGTRE